MKLEHRFATLADAVCYRDVEHARALLGDGADVNQKLSTGETLLHKAARESTAEMVHMLLEAGASVAVVTKTGGTALSSAACRTSDSEGSAIVRLLLAAGADPHAGAFGYSALHGAVYAGNLDTARLLIDAGADVNAATELSDPPLVMALERASKDDEASIGGRHLVLCEMLLNAGANASFVPDGAPPTYLTPFHKVVSWGWLKWIDSFVKVGGEDPGQKTLDGRTMVRLFPNNNGVKLAEAKELFNMLKTEFALQQVLQTEASDKVVPSRDRSSGLSPL